MNDVTPSKIYRQASDLPLGMVQESSTDRCTASDRKRNGTTLTAHRLAFRFEWVIGLYLILFSGCTTPSPTITGSGVIEAVEIMISPAIAGEIRQLPLDEGTFVKNGDLIAQLDTESIELEREAAIAGIAEIDAAEIHATAQISQARTVLEGVKKTYDRSLALKKKGSISDQVFDDAESAYRVAIKQVATLESALEPITAKRKTLDARITILNRTIRDGIIKAPIAAIVLEKYAEIGERTMPGRSIVKIGDLSRVWTKIYVSETDLGKVKLQANAKILVDSYPDTFFSGAVTWISSAAEFTPKNIQTRDARSELVYGVKIMLPNPDGIFKIGMPVDVLLEGFPEFTTQSRNQHSS